MREERGERAREEVEGECGRRSRDSQGAVTYRVHEDLRHVKSNEVFCGDPRTQQQKCQGVREKKRGPGPLPVA